MTTSQMQLITVTVDGRPLGVFDTLTGGEPTAEVPKHRPGGMTQERSYPGLPSFGDLTVGRELDQQRDLELYRSLVNRVGRASFTVSRQLLDENGAPVGRPITYIGRLSAMTDPEADSNSNDPSMWQMTAVITGRA
ncbi:hypothetical protein [Nocardioides soli]|uniref:Phage tail protein n=1 Tax=Nocardioides soli TaxID=1036020 RepID=A0A7W4VT46_9ACTN|nr:hypothetical protein [Nocardioides soli]MBB3041023.1 hypothetical protein [Nocardioides soli]